MPAGEWRAAPWYDYVLQNQPGVFDVNNYASQSPAAGSPYSQVGGQWYFNNQLVADPDSVATQLLGATGKTQAERDAIIQKYIEDTQYGIANASQLANYAQDPGPQPIDRSTYQLNQFDPKYDPVTGHISHWQPGEGGGFSDFFGDLGSIAAAIALTYAGGALGGAASGAEAGFSSGIGDLTAGLGAGASGFSGVGSGIAGLSGGLSGAAGSLGTNLAGDASWGANAMPDTSYDFWDFGDSAGGLNLSDYVGDIPIAGEAGTSIYNPTSIMDYVNQLKLSGMSPTQVAQYLGQQLPSMPPGTQQVLKSLLGSNNGLNNMGLLGGLLGALAGGLGANQKPAGTTTSIQDIPDYLKPYQSMNLNSGVQNFQASGLGGAILPGAMMQMGKTINGDYLDPNTNPAFQPYAKDLMGNALSVFNGQYGGSAGGNLNNSGFQEGAARAITNAALPLYNQAYQFERGNQVNAAGQAPAFASNYAGAALAPNLAFKNLYSGPQATTTPYFTNPGAGIFSGGLAGLTLGNAFGKG